MSERTETTRVAAGAPEHGEGGEMEGRSLTPPAFQLMASPVAPPPPGDGGAGAGGGTGSGDAVAQLHGPEGISVTTSDTAGSDEFYREFNREFAPVIQILEPDEHSEGERVSAARLNQLFSARERQLLLEFCRTHMIPDGLWNTGDHCNTDARQRIMLAAHILDQGLLRHGSRTEELHARMCGHWATLVYAYAGATRAVGPSAGGVMGNFDHSGHVVFGTGTASGEMGRRVEASELPAGQMDDIGEIQEGTDHAEALAAARASGDDERIRRFARLRGIPIGEFDNIEAGDWLWVYNGNGSGIGAHSVIFSHWITEFGPSPNGGQCRRGIAYSQGHPADGGRRHEIEVGDRFYYSETPYRCVSPIVNWIHISEDAHAAETIEEILHMAPGAASATSEPAAAPAPAPRGRRARRDTSVRGRNESHLLRAASGGRSIDVNALYANLVAEINGYMTTLSPHMSARQIEIIRPYLTAREGTTIDFTYLEVLVRLIQRLKPMATNSVILDRNSADAESGVAERYARTAPARMEDIRENNAVARTKMDELAPTVRSMLELADDFASHPRAAEIAPLFTQLQSQFNAVNAGLEAATQGERLAESLGGGEGLNAAIRAAMEAAETAGSPIGRGAAFERVLQANGMDLGEYDRITNAAAAYARGAVAIVATMTTLQQTVGTANRRYPMIRTYRGLFGGCNRQRARLNALARTLRSDGRSAASYHLVHPGNISNDDRSTSVTGLLSEVRPLGTLLGFVRSE